MRSPFVRRPLFALVILAATNCAHRQVATIVHDAPQRRTWMGEGMATVAKVWGPCNSPEPDGSGGRVCVYEAEDMVYPTPRFPSVEHPPGEVGPSNDPYPGPIMATLKPLARFWLNADGKVYRYWFAASVWKSHVWKTRPPQ